MLMNVFVEDNGKVSHGIMALFMIFLSMSISTLL